MTDQRTNILEAAVQVFMRYGVGRARMGDIAAEAGVVRQTLYSFFKNKDQILCAAIRHYADLSLAAVQRDWAGQQDLGDKLETFYAHAILPSYAIVTASTDARDMIDGYSPAGRAETQRAQTEKARALQQVLTDHMPTRAKSVTAEHLADFIVLSAIGLRDQARSEDHLRTLLETQKQSVLALITA